MKFRAAVVTFAIMACFSTTHAEVVTKIAAVVNDHIITTYQLEKAVNGILSTQGRSAPLGLQERQALRAQVLGGLIDEELVRQKVEGLGIKVTDEELEATLRDVQKQSKVTTEQLRAAVEAQGMSFQDYREKLRQQVLKYKLVGREVQSKVNVTNREVSEYYRNHIDDYRTPSSMHLSRITFAVDSKASPAEVSKIKEAAQDARKRVQGGEDFLAVMLALTTDKSAEGGDMGTFEEGELTPVFDEAVKKLQPGEVSELVETPMGFYLFRMESRLAGNLTQFDAVKDDIQQTLLEKKREDKFKEWATGLRKNAYIDIRE